jgi:TonB family protein
MNPPGTKSAAWTRGRFLGVAGGLFVLQAVLLLVFADRASHADSPAPLRTHFLALGSPVREDQLLNAFFVGDPSVFAWPGVHGFSGRAWLSQRPTPYRPSNRLEAPAWLALDLSRLGSTSPAGTVRAAAPLFLDLAGQMAPPLEPLPVFLPPAVVQTQSVFRLQGDVRQRWTGPPPLLPPQPSAQLLTNSVVEIAIDAEGNVLVHRLLARSGSAAADEAALAAAKALRFLPSAAPEALWGQAIFEWHTIQETNAGAAE